MRSENQDLTRARSASFRAARGGRQRRGPRNAFDFSRGAPDVGEWTARVGIPYCVHHGSHCGSKANDYDAYATTTIC